MRATLGCGGSRREPRDLDFARHHRALGRHGGDALEREAVVSPERIGPCPDCGTYHEDGVCEPIVMSGREQELLKRAAEKPIATAGNVTPPDRPLGAPRVSDERLAQIIDPNANYAGA